jgi:hypothetical protein
MRITWTFEGKGAGAATVATVDEAVSALTVAVRDAYGGLSTEALARVLHGVLGPVRHQLVTDGRCAVERGDEWSTSRGGILVHLSPTDGP